LQKNSRTEFFEQGGSTGNITSALFLDGLECAGTDQMKDLAGIAINDPADVGSSPYKIAGDCIILAVDDYPGILIITHSDPGSLAGVADAALTAFKL